ncbi:hypothetical protein M0R88_11200 [Halorussus gelatinilyticus]|uniref:Uncharacterized protein n=1 Tax=Halorussus gelatinilyticus TaxID=2937524 RepID=A0A8U0IFM6_9EURY|nr:hypothetical protein [Halorussus gelatinilyticus]UPV99093.1 hypothetical protein M0R88_11200 [Halorussus gelatinilyticus]
MTERRGTSGRGEPSLDVGVVYVPFVGDKFGECTTVAHPAVGRYGDPIPPEVTDEHVRQLLEAGASTVMFNFGEGDDDHERFRAYDDAESSDELDLEPFYVVGQALRRDRDLETDLAFVREHFLGRPNIGRFDGRPVVTLWDVLCLHWAGMQGRRTVRDYVRDRYGGFGELVEFVRSELTVDGLEPFLVGDVFNAAVGGFPDWADPALERLDGVTYWVGYNPANPAANWDEAYDHIETNYDALSSYADENDLAFFPTVIPGFDDLHNECWGLDRRIPRSPEHFRELLALATRYSDRVSVATFNDWTEGTHIERGRFRSENHGSAYLDVLASFSGGKS